MTKILTILLLTLTHLSFSQKNENSEEKVTEIEYASNHTLSLINLISTPEKYHGKKVQVIGYLNLEFEGNGLYLHKEDYEYSIYSNGFWVSFDKNTIQKIVDEKLNNEYVLLVGVFNMNKRGHMGLWSGEIEQINRIIKWN
jgi:hypothetical protein